MTLSSPDSGRLAGARVIDPHGEKVGAVTEVVYTDDTSTEPEWIIVGYGTLRPRKALVPLYNSYRSTDGDLVLPYDRAMVHQGPKSKALVPSGRELLDAAAHYGISMN